eukprot:3369229-Rhodomonas_salina.3
MLESTLSPFPTVYVEMLVPGDSPANLGFTTPESSNSTVTFSPTLTPITYTVTRWSALPAGVDPSSHGPRQAPNRRSAACPAHATQRAHVLDVHDPQSIGHRELQLDRVPQRRHSLKRGEAGIHPSVGPRRRVERAHDGRQRDPSGLSACDVREGAAAEVEPAGSDAEVVDAVLDERERVQTAREVSEPDAV